MEIQTTTLNGADQSRHHNVHQTHASSPKTGENIPQHHQTGQLPWN